MKRPKKKGGVGQPGTYEAGYDQACSDWEAYHEEVIEDLCIEHCKELERWEEFLPDEEELIIKIRRLLCGNNQIGSYTVKHDKDAKMIAKAIHRRIHNETRDQDTR